MSLIKDIWASREAWMPQAKAGIAAAVKNPMVQAGIIAPLALGIGAGIATGSVGAGISSASMSVGGASMGYMKGGVKGAFIGSVIGAAAGAGSNRAAEAGLGTFGSAAVAGVSASLGASLATTSLVRGGMGFKMLSGLISRAPKHAQTQMTDIYKSMLGHDPLTDPRGFASNISDSLRAIAGGAKAAGVNNALTRNIGLLDKSPTATRIFDASFGSPGLLDLAKSTGIENASTGQLAKVIGKDIIEGIPVGVGTGLLGAGIGAAFGGFSEKGAAASKRHSMTDFGSPWQGPVKSKDITADMMQHNIKGWSRTWAKGVERSNRGYAVGRSIKERATGMPSFAKQMAKTQMDFAKFNARMVGAGISGVNSLSKVALGANLGQLGFAAGVTAAAGYGIMSALGISGQQAAGAAQQFHETMKQSAKPVYGYSELGQSTQGLVFGLHSRRTR